MVSACGEMHSEKMGVAVVPRDADPADEIERGDCVQKFDRFSYTNDSVIYELKKLTEVPHPHRAINVRNKVNV